VAAEAGWPTVRSLAHDLCGNGFFEASGHLGGQTTGHFLGILKHIQYIHTTPPQGDHMQAAVEVRIVAIVQRCSDVLLYKYGGMPRPAIHRGAVDLEIGQDDAAEALEPEVQGSFVVTLATKRMDARKSVMNLRHDSLQQLIPVAAGDVIKPPSDHFV